MFFYCVRTGQGASQACNRLVDLQEFKSSQTIKVNPDRPQQQARFVALEVSQCWKTKNSCQSLCSPLNQGAFTACTKVSELQVFTQATEVKVDPDKPLEGARLAVLQVALYCGNAHKEPLCPKMYYKKCLPLFLIMSFSIWGMVYFRNCDRSTEDLSYLTPFNVLNKTCVLHTGI